MRTKRQNRGEVRRVMRRTLNPCRFPTTQGFAALHDHARLPWRFFGRFTASLAAGLTCA
ncbi:MAG TPA: hypothetical protein VGN91_29305 [Bosea sp. (in: a-proteobacteria)]|nr:hypothetical protein [Bosea sp. (in: a-proteobacteria)]